MTIMVELNFLESNVTGLMYLVVALVDFIEQGAIGRIEIFERKFRDQIIID